MIRDQLIAALAGALDHLGIAPVPENIGLERPARREHGDWSSNIALAVAKTAGRNPRELGTELAEHLDANRPDGVAKVDVAGPGFVNFHLDDASLHAIITTAVAEGPAAFGAHTVGADQVINVEFVSANPNKPVHAGHARGACYGDSIARLFEKCGYEVQRENYLNDRGTQMQAFAASLAARKRGEEPAEDGYHGEYLIDWAAEMPDDADPLEWGRGHAIASHRATMSSVNVEFDIWYSERSMVADGKIDAALADLGERGALYEEDGATWFRSSDFGDEKDRVLVRSNGELTYFAPDIAYHRDKFSRAPKLINVWGADHHGYVARMKGAMQALGHDRDELEIIITQLVRLERGGESVKMSGRAGDMVTFDDIIAEAGPDAARFTYLMQSVDTEQTIDLELIAQKVMDNPVFYVQMAHARLCSIETNAVKAGVVATAVADVDLTPLVEERELEVIRKLSEFPDIVMVATNGRAPHRIASWLREFAAAVHGFYHDCYVVGDGITPEVTQARLALVAAAKVGLQSGLDLLGVSAPEAM